MDTAKASVKKIAYTYGFYLALLSIIGLVIGYVADLYQNWVVGSISFILMILILVYGIINFKRDNANFISLGQAIKVGLAISAIGGVIAAIYAYIHYGYIDPNFVEMIREQQMLQFEEQSANMSEEQIEQTTNFMNIFTSPFFLATMSLMWTLFIGFIISLITGAIIKNNRPQGY